MKRILGLFVLVGLAVCVAGAVNAQNLLVDPGMNSVGPNGQFGNTPNSPWVVEASQGGVGGFQDGAASETWADVDGGGYGLFFKSFTGNPPWNPTAGMVTASIYQDHAGAMPGALYTLHGWFGAEPNYAGLNDNLPTQSLFMLEFLDGGGSVLSSAVQDLKAGLQASAGGADWGERYQEYWVMANAPAGAVTVRARASMVDAVFNQDPGQAFVTDYWTLTCVPEPATFALLGLAAIGFVGIRRRSN